MWPEPNGVAERKVSSEFPVLKLAKTAWRLYSEDMLDDEVRTGEKNCGGMRTDKIERSDIRSER